jgi:hypothetical protein
VITGRNVGVAIIYQNGDINGSLLARAGAVINRLWRTIRWWINRWLFSADSLRNNSRKETIRENSMSFKRWSEMGASRRIADTCYSGTTTGRGELRPWVVLRQEKK